MPLLEGTTLRAAAIFDGIGGAPAATFTDDYRVLKMEIIITMVPIIKKKMMTAITAMMRVILIM